MTGLLTRQGRDTGQVLALKQLERRTTSGRDMRELVLYTVFGRNSSSVTTTNDDNLAALCSSDGTVECRLGALGELVKLEHTSRAVPEDGLRLVNGFLVQLDRLLSAVETHPAVGDAVLVLSIANIGILVKLVGGDVVDRQNNLDVVLLRLLNKVLDRLAASLVEQAVTNLDALESLLEGKGHASADDQAVDLAKQVVNQLDLVRDLRTTKDGEERSLGRLKRLGKVVELLLDKEARSLLWEVDADHGAVCAVGSTESVVCG